MNYKKLNNITGWIVFLIASYVYLATIEPTTSLWDCGEYITTSNKLEVGHPPGAPTFMILGAIFSSFTGPEGAAAAINAMSALSSSFAILFLFWSITMFASKFAKARGEMGTGEHIAVLASGVIGALGLTFTDSMWFNAVEGEVYAMSTLLTAATFWAGLKWESEADVNPRADKWLVLVFYLVGLSIGVHLLNLLAIPAIAFIYYFKKYKFSPRGFVLAGAIGGGVLGLVQAVVIPGIPKLAAGFERLFVNSFGAGFNVGSLIFAIVLLVSVGLGIHYTSKLKKGHWNTALMSFAVLVIGYSTFAMIVIRSNANPPLDENNPETMGSLVAYLGREQYGSWPVLTGPSWNAPLVGFEDAKPSYMQVYALYNDAKRIKIGKGRKAALAANKFKRDAVKMGVNLKSSKGSIILQKGNVNFASEWDAKEFLRKLDDLKAKYGDQFALPFNPEIKETYINVNEGKRGDRIYDPNFVGLFPRMHFGQGKEAGYMAWSNYEGDKSYPVPYLKQQYDRAIAAGDYKTADNIKSKGMYKPTSGENWAFFANYQFNWMYLRYFLWNFAGRQNDIQGHWGIHANSHALTEGNWLSGVKFIDESRLGNRDKVPEAQLSDKGYNRYYLLPLLLGLIGMVFQLVRAPKDWFIVFLLFVFTGIMIIVYLNQKPVEPRERDYAYCGSYYAFAIWIGMGVYALFDSAKHLKMSELTRVLGIVFGIAIISLMFNQTLAYSLFYMGGIVAVLLLIMVGVGKASSNPTLAALVVSLICLPVPIVLASENWDDHDRSGRYAARDFAYNYLMSCDKNAILFTNGDNDTFPLWYIQEVEGVRTDVRVVNLSLLSTDWHASQVKRKAYDSDPVPFSLPESKYRAGVRDLVEVEESPENIKITEYNKKLDARNAQIQQLNSTLPSDQHKPLLTKKEHIYMPASEAVSFLTNDANRRKSRITSELESYIRGRRFSVKVDTAKVRANGIVPKGYTGKIESEIKWKVSGSYMQKSGMLVLDLLANYNWDRPIYFSSSAGPGANKDLRKYFQAEGLVYKLTPIKSGGSSRFNSDKMYKLFMGEDFSETCRGFKWGRLDDKDVFVDHYTMRMVNNARVHFLRLAEQLNKEGKKEEAINVLNKGFEVLPLDNVPIDYAVPYMCSVYFQAGAKEKGAELAEVLSSHAIDNLNYHASLQGHMFDLAMDEAAYSLNTIEMIAEVMNGAEDTMLVELGYENTLAELRNKFATRMQQDPKMVEKIRDPRLNPRIPFKITRKWFPQLYGQKL